MSDLATLCAQLDKMVPQWHVRWANEEELRQIVQAVLSGEDGFIRDFRLKSQVADRIVLPVLNAAIQSQIVKPVG